MGQPARYPTVLAVWVNRSSETSAVAVQTNFVSNHIRRLSHAAHFGAECACTQVSKQSCDICWCTALHSSWFRSSWFRGDVLWTCVRCGQLARLVGRYAAFRAPSRLGVASVRAVPTMTVTLTRHDPSFRCCTAGASAQVVSGQGYQCVCGPCNLRGAV